MPIYALLLALVGAIIQGLFIAVEHKQRYVPAVVLKGSASVVFCILGFWASAECANPAFAKLIRLGLIFGALGDILLNLRFVFSKAGQKIFLVGIVAFLTGHILYLAALLPLSEHLLTCLMVGVLAAAGLLTWIFKTMEVKLAFKLFGVIYIGAVVVMTAVAVGNLIAAPLPVNALFAIGAVLFTVSDIVLIFNTFGPQQKFSLRICNLSLYYLGQLLIACCLFFYR